MSGNDVERMAWDLIARFGELAVPIARKLAAVSGEVQDHMLHSAEAWQHIINTIEQLNSSQ